MELDNSHIGQDLHLFRDPCLLARSFVDTLMNLRLVSKSWNQHLINARLYLLRLYASKYDHYSFIDPLEMETKNPWYIELIRSQNTGRSDCRHQACQVVCCAMDQVVHWNPNKPFERLEALLAHDLDFETEMQQILARRPPRLCLLSWCVGKKSLNSIIPSFNLISTISHLFLRKVGVSSFASFTQEIQLPNLSMLSIEIVVSFDHIKTIDSNSLQTLQARLPRLKRLELLHHTGMNAVEAETNFTLGCSATIKELVYESEADWGQDQQFMRDVAMKLPNLTLYGTNPDTLFRSGYFVMANQDTRLFITNSFALFTTTLHATKGLICLQDVIKASGMRRVIIDKSWIDLRQHLLHLSATKRPLKPALIHGNYKNPPPWSLQRSSWMINKELREIGKALEEMEASGVQFQDIDGQGLESSIGRSILTMTYEKNHDDNE